MLRFIDFATVIGARTIRVDFCPWGTGGEMPPEAFDIIVERYREYAEICYSRGMKSVGEPFRLGQHSKVS